MLLKIDHNQLKRSNQSLCSLDCCKFSPPELIQVPSLEETWIFLQFPKLICVEFGQNRAPVDLKKHCFSDVCDGKSMKLYTVRVSAGLLGPGSTRTAFCVALTECRLVFQQTIWQCVKNHYWALCELPKSIGPGSRTVARCESSKAKSINRSPSLRIT